MCYVLQQFVFAFTLHLTHFKKNPLGVLCQITIYSHTAYVFYLLFNVYLTYSAYCIKKNYLVKFKHNFRLRDQSVVNYINIILFPISGDITSLTSFLSVLQEPVSEDLGLCPQ